MPKKPKGKMGHNSITADVIKSVLDRVDRLEEEKAGLASDVRDIYQEAKGNGLDVATLKSLRKLRNMDNNEREEKMALLSLYAKAVGMEDPFS